MKARCTILFVIAAAILRGSVTGQSVPLTDIGEGSISGFVPLVTDTVTDTSFGAGDTLWLTETRFEVKPPAYARQEATVPSVKTVVRIVAGDGFASGTVRQTFRNPFDLPFEATYIFPLPHDGAVHGMDFRTSTGVFHADLKEKEQARKEYEQAKQEGKQASLLLQSQDNIFVQKLCNIPPRDSVSVTIAFSMALAYDMGTFELSFPTVVGPRYSPAPLPKRTANPLYLPPDTRSGTTLDFAVLLASPYPLSGVECPSHPVDIETANLTGSLRDLCLIESDQTIPDGVTGTLIRLTALDQIPNKDIVVRYRRASERRDASVLSWHDGTQGYFAMSIYPDLVDTATDRPSAIDMVFVLDKSGSMAGVPLTKAKEVMHAMLDRVTDDDRISFIAFSDRTDSLFATPAPATAANVERAREWINVIQANGGTQMLQGVQQALRVPMSSGRTRVLSLITDGLIGDVDGIYNAIANDPNQNVVFAFGVGNSTNQTLIDGAATAGNGIGKNIYLNDDVDQIVSEFWTRIRLPQIADIEIDWGGDVAGLTMQQIPDLWQGQPITIFGQYTTGGPRTITLAGTRNGQPVAESYPVTFVTNNTLVSSVPQMWAREIIEQLINDQVSTGDEHNKDAILETSLAFTVLCTYTAFLAVADSVVNAEGRMVSTQVPVPVPSGIDPVTSGAEYYPLSGTGSMTTGAPVVAVGGTGIVTPSFHLTMDAGKLQLSLRDLPAGLNDGTVSIFDARGRLVYRWRIAELGSRNFTWTWDFVDMTGNRVSRGGYMLVVKSVALKTSRIVVCR